MSYCREQCWLQYRIVIIIIIHIWVCVLTKHFTQFLLNLSTNQWKHGFCNLYCAVKNEILFQFHCVDCSSSRCFKCGRWWRLEMGCRNRVKFEIWSQRWALLPFYWNFIVYFVLVTLVSVQYGSLCYYWGLLRWHRRLHSFVTVFCVCVCTVMFGQSTFLDRIGKHFQ